MGLLALSFLIQSLWFSIYMISWSASRENVTSSFLIWMPFVSVSYPNKSLRAVRNEGREVVFPYTKKLLAKLNQCRKGRTTIPSICLCELWTCTICQVYSTLESSVPQTHIQELGTKEAIWETQLYSTHYFKISIKCESYKN